METQHISDPRYLLSNVREGVQESCWGSVASSCFIAGGLKDQLCGSTSELLLIAVATQGSTQTCTKRELGE